MLHFQRFEQLISHKIKGAWDHKGGQRHSTRIRCSTYRSQVSAWSRLGRGSHIMPVQQHCSTFLFILLLFSTPTSHSILDHSSRAYRTATIIPIPENVVAVSRTYPRSSILCPTDYQVPANANEAVVYAKKTSAESVKTLSRRRRLLSLTFPAVVQYATAASIVGHAPVILASIAEDSCTIRNPSMIRCCKVFYS